MRLVAFILAMASTGAWAGPLPWGKYSGTATLMSRNSEYTPRAEAIEIVDNTDGGSSVMVNGQLHYRLVPSDSTGHNFEVQYSAGDSGKAVCGAHGFRTCTIERLLDVGSSQETIAIDWEPAGNGSDTARYIMYRSGFSTYYGRKSMWQGRAVTDPVEIH